MTVESDDESADRYVTDNHFSGIAHGPVIQTGQIEGPLTVRVHSAPTAADRLAEVADDLALAVGTRWRQEEELHQVLDPIPMPVRWQDAPENLIDDWSNICRVPVGESADPIPLAGDLTKIATVYQDIPSRRLVVLGQAGSGKTILAIRLVLELLEIRTPADPVPVIVNFGSWNPVAVRLEQWLIGQLVRDHPGLGAAGPNGSTLAAALVGAGLILPVLDGFDEIADGLHRAALTALNEFSSPLVLTSRREEYVDAVQGTDVLTAAVAIELADLTLADLADYLPRTTRKTTLADTENVWVRMLADLRDHPDESACARLTAALATPLMVALARASYSDTPDTDPSALLDARRFDTQHALEEHLIGSFLANAYRPTSTGPGRRRWDAERAQRWLGYLARHLDRQHSQDLAWWRLGNSLPTPTRMVASGVATGVCFGLMIWLYYSVVACATRGSGNIFFWFYEYSVSSIVSGVAAGLAFGLAVGLLLLIRPAGIEPVTVRWRLVNRTRQANRRRRVLAMAGIGLASGTAYGVVYGIVIGLVWLVGVRQPVHIGLALYFALVVGPPTALVIGLGTWFEAPLEVRSTVRPADLLRTNRRAMLAQALWFAPVLGLAVALNSRAVVGLVGGLLGETEWDLSGGLATAITGMLSGGVAYVLSLTAWGHWFVLARVWLPLTGRLPWALPTFLDDAHERGVLRQAGAVYQFRHDRLKDHLARAVNASGEDSAAT